MVGLRYSKRSRADLVEIWDFIAADSLHNAEAVMDRIHLKCETLPLQPLMGHRRDDLRRGSRCVTSDGYMIFYRQNSHLASPARIVHHSRNLPAVDLGENP